MVFIALSRAIHEDCHLYQLRIFSSAHQDRHFYLSNSWFQQVLIWNFSVIMYSKRDGSNFCCLFSLSCTYLWAAMWWPSDTSGLFHCSFYLGSFITVLTSALHATIVDKGIVRGNGLDGSGRYVLFCLKEIAI